MTYPPYIREKAEWMRRERRLSVNEIAERLDISKATAYGWVGHIPLQRPPNVRAMTAGRKKAAAAVSRKYRLLREEAYQEGCEAYDALCLEPTFRDFVSLYIAEGYNRGRTWRCKYGVFSVIAKDTLLRARVQAWMDLIEAEWLTLAA
jgi:hypothetical protein